MSITQRVENVAQIIWSADDIGGTSTARVGGYTLSDTMLGVSVVRPNGSLLGQYRDSVEALAGYRSAVEVMTARDR